MAATADVTDASPATLIYDGDCGFCTVSAMSVKRRVDGDSVRVVPWQSLDLAKFGLTEAEVSSAAYWVGPDGSLRRGHEAVTDALVAMGRPYSLLGRLVGVPPFRWLAPPVYALVARYRHRLPGATDACRL